MSLRVKWADDTYTTFPSLPTGFNWHYYKAEGLSGVNNYFAPNCQFFDNSDSYNGILVEDLFGKTTKTGCYFIASNNSARLVLGAAAKAKMYEFMGVSPDYFGAMTHGTRWKAHIGYDAYTNSLSYYSTFDGALELRAVTKEFYYLDGSSAGTADIYYNGSAGSASIKDRKIRTIDGNEVSVRYQINYYIQSPIYAAYLYSNTNYYGSNFINGSSMPDSEKFLDVIFGEGNYMLMADEGESIYTPGGTSSDPHNPYPSGDSPYTVDPLDSGTDTTSTSTPGTWELPFDEVPDTPATVHSVDLGLYNVYALSALQVKELANYLFSGITELGENLVKLIWGSKRDVIISLYEFPFMVTTQGTDTIRFIFDTDLAGLFHGKQLTSEYIPIDFGTIQVDRYSGTFYDFEPYTTLTLYIPYIGYIDLKPTEVVGSTLSIRGYVHLTTGELNVNVRSSRTGILGSYSGTIGRMLPIADADATEIYSSIIKTAASLGAVALAGAGMATASRAAAGISAPNKQTVDSARDTYMQSVGAWGAATRGVRGLEASMLQAQGAYDKAQSDYAEQAGKYNNAQSAVRANREDFHDSASDAISNSLDAVTTGFGVSRGTVMTSSNGRVSPQRCFLRIEVPHQNVSRQQKILGYPANTSDALNSDRLHGYTELRTIELSIPNATLTEIQELEDILRGGFYLP